MSLCERKVFNPSSLDWKIVMTALSAGRSVQVQFNEYLAKEVQLFGGLEGGDSGALEQPGDADGDPWDPVRVIEEAGKASSEPLAERSGQLGDAGGAASAKRLRRGIHGGADVRNVRKAIEVPLHVRPEVLPLREGGRRRGGSMRERYPGWVHRRAVLRGRGGPARRHRPTEGGGELCCHAL